MDRLNEIHLEKLKELASNFDADERNAVLSAIPEEYIRNYLAEARIVDVRYSTGQVKED